MTERHDHPHRQRPLPRPGKRLPHRRRGPGVRGQRHDRAVPLRLLEDKALLRRLTRDGELPGHPTSRAHPRAADRRILSRARGVSGSRRQRKRGANASPCDNSRGLVDLPLFPLTGPIWRRVRTQSHRSSSPDAKLVYACCTWVWPEAREVFRVTPGRKRGAASRLALLTPLHAVAQLEPTSGFEPPYPSLRGPGGVCGWLRSMALKTSFKPISTVSPPNVLRLVQGGVLPPCCHL